MKNQFAFAHMFVDEKDVLNTFVVTTVLCQTDNDLKLVERSALLSSITTYLVIIGDIYDV